MLLSYTRELSLRWSISTVILHVNAELLQTEDTEEQSLHACRQVIEAISKFGGNG